MAATKTRVPDEGISSFLGNTGKLEEAEGEGKDGAHWSLPLESVSFSSPLDAC